MNVLLIYSLFIPKILAFDSKMHTFLCKRNVICFIFSNFANSMEGALRTDGMSVRNDMHLTT